MTVPRKIPVPIDSRYKDTPILEDADGNIFPDLWVEPAEIAEDQKSTLRHLPIPSDVGRLDLVSNVFFNTTVPWWSIASINGIRDQVEDMQAAVEEEPRKLFVIPRQASVQSFLTR